MENREKLNNFLKMNNLSRKRFCDMVPHLKPAAFSRWFDGKQMSFRKKTIKEIVKACEEIIDQSDLSREYMMKEDDF